MTFRTVVVIPTYNERENIERLVNGLLEAFDSKSMESSVIIVDDNSPDGTAEAVRALEDFQKRVFLVVRPAKMGLGSAYAEGYRQAIKSLSPDCIIQMDADLSHPPELATELAKAVEEGFDVAIGSRYVRGGGTRAWSLGRRLTSKGANLLIRTLLRTGLHDNTSGYRAMKIEVVQSILEHDLRSRGYGYNVETIYLYHKLKLRVRELALMYGSREKGQTKLSLFEIIRFFGTTVRLWLRGMRRISAATETET
ncbi:MAG: polyprenol monophosphomannose synthase [Thaumarchaeota archaeon]|nr:polyprenol monophosphomannose synthase [Nitrososphaerota archaeon]